MSKKTRLTLWWLGLSDLDRIEVIGWTAIVLIGVVIVVVLLGN